MERRWLVAASCITLLLTACPKSQQDIAEELKEAVVMINYPKPIPGHGTGFFVQVQGSEDVCTVVTARHVVAPSNELQLQTHDGKLWQTSNIESFPNYDLAVVTFEPETWKKKGKTGKTKTCPYRALEMGDSDRVKDGDTIYIRGFPREHVSRGVSLFSNGTVSGIVKPPILAGYGLFYQATTADGMSGGPVVNVDGQVIGVHGRTDTEIIRIASSPQSNLSLAEKARVETVARIDNFKWGVPINIYLENQPVHPPALVESPVKLPKEWLLGGTVGVGLLLIMRWLRSGSSSKTAETWYNQGNKLLNANKYSEAIASYEKAIEIKPDFHDTWNWKGIALYELQRYSEAIASYEKAIEIKPDFHDTWNNRGVALYELQRYSEAITSYEKAIEIKPEDYKIWHNRGNALKELQRYIEAIASYEKAIEIKPDFHDSWNWKGIALSKLQRYSEAIRSYDKLLEIRPDFALALYNKACCYALQSKIELAIENLQQAIEFDPDHSPMAKTDSDFDNIRHDKRFQALIER